MAQINLCWHKEGPALESSHALRGAAKPCAGERRGMVTPLDQARGHEEDDSVPVGWMPGNGTSRRGRRRHQEYKAQDMEHGCFLEPPRNKRLRKHA